MWHYYSTDICVATVKTDRPPPPELGFTRTGRILQRYAGEKYPFLWSTWRRPEVSGTVTWTFIFLHLPSRTVCFGRYASTYCSRSCRLISAAITGTFLRSSAANV